MGVCSRDSDLNADSESRPLVLTRCALQPSSDAKHGDTRTPTQCKKRPPSSSGHLFLEKGESSMEVTGPGDDSNLNRVPDALANGGLKGFH